MYFNVKKLMKNAISKEGEMNRFQVLLNQLKNNTEKLDVKGDETNQNLI